MIGERLAPRAYRWCEGDQVGVLDPKVGVLRESRWSLTDTLPLLAGSAAINKANATTAPERDQRGYVREDAADVGAFEFGGTIPVTLANISTRLSVGTGDNVLIGGFIVTGTEAKKVIVAGDWAFAAFSRANSRIRRSNSTTPRDCSSPTTTGKRLSKRRSKLPSSSHLTISNLPSSPRCRPMPPTPRSCVGRITPRELG